MESRALREKLVLTGKDSSASESRKRWSDEHRYGLQMCTGVGPDAHRCGLQLGLARSSRSSFLLPPLSVEWEAQGLSGGIQGVEDTQKTL